MFGIVPKIILLVMLQGTLLQMISSSYILQPPLAIQPSTSIKICSQYSVDKDIITVTCNNQNFTSVPVIDVPNGNYSKFFLSLEDNFFTTLEDNSFVFWNQQDDRFVEKYYLYLRNCNIHHILNDAFNGLSKLYFLSLTNNKLTHVPTTALSKLSNLSVLDLSGNQIHKVQRDAFPGLISLRALVMMDCHISEIEEEAFVSLKNLFTLIMVKNEITSVSPDVFAGVPETMVAILRDNLFTCDCQLAEVMHLRKMLPSTFGVDCSLSPALKTCQDYFTEFVSVEPSFFN